MRWRRHLTVVLAALAVLWTSAAPAQQPATDGATVWASVPRRLPPAPATKPRSTTVGFAIDPAIAPAHRATIRAVLERHAFVRVVTTGPVFELTTRPDYPLTLLLRQAPSDTGTRLGELVGDPLGNLALDDWQAPLEAALGRIGRRLALLTLSAGSADARATTCWRDRRYGPTQCSSGGTFAPVTAELPVVGGGAEFPIDYAVRNDATSPRYLALVDLTADAGEVRRLPAGDGRPVPPGGWAIAGGGGARYGGHTLVTISSAMPIPDAMLAVEGGDCAGQLGARLCGRPDAGADRDWAAASADYQLQWTPPVAVGGGHPVPPGRAPWMVEMYSLVPYTAAEIAADALKPPGERDYLAERSAAERDHVCGGSRIAPDLVLTAAHCVAKGRFAGAGGPLVFERRRIRVGTDRLGSGGTTYAIDGVAVHAGYVGGRQRDDIALVHLRADHDTKPADDRYAAIGLPSARAVAAAAVSAPVTAFGWGYTGAVAPGTRAILTVDNTVQHNPDQLQFGNLEVMDWPACSRRVGPDLTETMLCAVTRRSGALPRLGESVFSCVGDSGGPLVGSERGRDLLVGIAS